MFDWEARRIVHGYTPGALTRWGTGVLAFIILVQCLCGCGTGAPTTPRVRIENAWVTPAPAPLSGDMGSAPTSAGYFTILNEGDAPDTLLGAQAAAVMMIHLHETSIVNDVAHMRMLDRVEIPPHSRVEFKPGGRHLMLMGPLYDLTPGMTIELVFHLEHSGEMRIQAPVRADAAP